VTASRERVRIAVIGCGRVTQERHLPALKSLSTAEVVAVADVDPTCLERVASHFQIGRRSTDFRSLVEDPEIDAVAVCVPAQFHSEVALAGLDAGKHLLVEKPLTLDLDECDRLIEHAGKSSVKVTVGFNLRWHRLLREAREIIRRGDFGEIELIRTTLTSHHDSIPDWRRRREQGGGAINEMAVHHFDLWRFLLESEVEEVFATSRSGEWDDESATATARLANGVLATSLVSQRTSSGNEVEIHGRDGCLRIDCYQFDGLKFSPTANSPGDIRVRVQGIAQALRELPNAAMRLRQGGDYVATYQAEWRHFIDSIQHDTPVECTLEDGRSATQVMLASLESAALGQPVKVANAQRRIGPIGTAIGHPLP
jgi:myo-inositol 2-dehydrogenase/D-chiro-inositol 1-dehydrogenase